MVQFVAPGEVFETPIVVFTIQHSQCGGVHLSKGNMEMGAAAFHMAYDETWAVGSDMEFRIDRSKELGQLCRRHLPFRGNRKMANAVSTASCGGERLSVMEGISIAREYLGKFIFFGFVEEMTGEIPNAADAADASRLDDHWRIARRCPRSASSSMSAFASSAS